jgi:hypothetical protein
MPQPPRYLLHRFLCIKTPRDIFPFLSFPLLNLTVFTLLVKILDNISQRGRTQVKCNVKEFGVWFMIVISNDVGVVIGFFEDGYFVSS